MKTLNNFFTKKVARKNDKEEGPGETNDADVEEALEAVMLKVFKMTTTPEGIRQCT